MAKGYKFQKLYVYQMALDYVDCIYSITNQLPDRERYLSYAIRSYLETIACFDIIERLEYFPTNELNLIRLKGHKLFVKLIAFQKSLN